MKKEMIRSIAVAVFILTCIAGAISNFTYTMSIEAQKGNGHFTQQGIQWIILSNWILMGCILCLCISTLISLKED